MIEEKHNDITLSMFERLSREGGFVHALAGKPRNYAPHRGVGREWAMKARGRVCEILGLPLECLTAPAQVMAGEVIRVEPQDVGRGRDGRGSAIPFVDGLICDTPGVPLVLLSADCPLICVYDPDRPAIGAVHAGWQGTVAGAVENLIVQMRRCFSSRPERVLAGISPAAGPCCYEIGDEVRRIAAGRLPNADDVVAVRNGRLTFDMWAANRNQLLRSGLDPENIELAGICSICDERFWSHRRDGADAGRTALFVALRG
ncbi:MAG TPA: polyphenol oxidase family protein [Phycisphaerae bacterium]|nr:polyphenol oxidase family protein [Phycisphaerae bacterium]